MAAEKSLSRINFKKEGLLQIDDNKKEFINEINHNKAGAFGTKDVNHILTVSKTVSLSIQS